MEKTTGPRLLQLADKETGRILIAESLADRGLYTEATRELEAALAINPGSVEAYLSLGNVRSRTRDHEGAIQAYHAALKLAPAHAMARLALGMLYLREMKMAEALHELSEAGRLDSALPLPHVLVGHIHLVEGRIEEAVASLLTAIRIDPKLSIARCHLGDARRAQGRHQEAMAAYREALKLSPRMSAAHVKIGDLHVIANRRDLAIPVYETALMFNPTLGGAHWRLGRIHAAEGRRLEAIREFKAELLLVGDHALGEIEGPTRPDWLLHCDLGDVYRAEGDYDEAIASYLRALALETRLLEGGSSGAGRAPGRLVLVPLRREIAPMVGDWTAEPAPLTVLIDRRSGGDPRGTADRRTTLVATREQAVLVLTPPAGPREDEE